MDIIRSFSWYRSEIPPRCRKPRDVYHCKEVVAHITEIPANEADNQMPLAILVHDKLYKDKYPELGDAMHIPYYEYHERLYKPSERFPAIERFRSFYERKPTFVDNEADIDGHIADFESEYVIRAGVVLEEASEPTYVITSSFSHTHILIEEWSVANDRRNILDVFRADELEECKQAILNSPGFVMSDSNIQYIQETEKSCRIEVLRPQVLKMHTYQNRIAEYIRTNIEQWVAKEILPLCYKDSWTAQQAAGYEELMLALRRRVFQDAKVQEQGYAASSNDIQRCFADIILEKYAAK